MAHVTPAQMECWHEDGFIQLAGFLAAEVDQLREWVAAVETADADRVMHHFEETPQGVRPSRTENFIPHHPGLKALLTQGKVLEAISELMGETAVVYKEKINYKYPGGGSYIAHQDAPAYEFIRFHVTCLIAVDPATTQSGCLLFASGRHQEGLIALDERGCIERGVAAQMEWTPAPVAPGDILCFSSYVPHKSDGNHTDQARRIIYVTYNALAEGDFREQYYADKRRSFAQSGLAQEGMISKIGHFQGKTVKP